MNHARWILSVLLIAVVVPLGCEKSSETTDPSPRPSNPDLDSDPSLYAVAVTEATMDEAAPIMPEGGPATTFQTRPVEVTTFSAVTGPGTAPAATPAPAGPATAPTAPSDAQPASSQQADAIRQVVRQMGQAMENGNREQFLSLVKSGDDGEEVASAMFDVITAMKQFEQAMVQKFGPDSVTSESMNMNVSLPEDDQLQAMQVQVDGDTAVATVPGEQQPMTFVRENGQWKADLASALPPGDDKQKMLTMLKGMAAAANDGRKMLDKPNVTAEQVQQAMMGRIMMLMMQGQSGQ
jgi:hypothetical protein